MKPIEIIFHYVAWKTNHSGSGCFSNWSLYQLPPETLCYFFRFNSAFWNRLGVPIEVYPCFNWPTVEWRFSRDRLFLLAAFRIQEIIGNVVFLDNMHSVRIKIFVLGSLIFYLLHKLLCYLLMVPKPFKQEKKLNMHVQLNCTSKLEARSSIRTDLSE